MKTLPSLINKLLNIIYLTLLLGQLSFPAYAETIKANSYFPSPFGSYDEIILTPQAAQPNPCEIGTFYVQTPGTPYFCQDNGSGTGEWVELYFQDPWTQVGNNIYPTDLSANVAVGTSNSQFKLTINDGGIVAVGGTETLSVTGAGGRFIWYPKKSALRIGRVAGVQWDDANIGNYSTVAGGDSNLVSGTISTIAAGSNNTIHATAVSSFIGGGRDNQISQYASAIAGGNQNISTQQYSFIGGGQSNNVSAENGVIIAGNNNTVSGISGVVGAGSGNTAAGETSVVVAGTGNQANNLYTFVGGGENNEVRERGGVIFSGKDNLIHSTADNYSVIGGGEGNAVSGNSSFIGAGINNSATDLKSMIGAGKDNSVASASGGIASGDTNSVSMNYGFIGAGQNNQINERYGGIAAGENNAVSAEISFIAAGTDNTVSSDKSAIAAGSNNTLNGNYSIIGSGSSHVIGNNTESAGIAAGTSNRINGGNYAFIAGGRNNYVNGASSAVMNGRNNRVTNGLASLVGGRNMRLLAPRSFVWGQSNAAVNIPTLNAFITQGVNVGIRNDSPDHLIHVGPGIGAYSDGAIWPILSSVKYKENVQKLSETEALETFHNLTPVTFDYKKIKGDSYAGFIAEDVPELVAMKDRKGLHDLDIIAVLVKTAQHQQKIIEENKKALEAIRKKLEK